MPSTRLWVYIIEFAADDGDPQMLMVFGIYNSADEAHAAANRREEHGRVIINRYVRPILVEG